VIPVAQGNVSAVLNANDLGQLLNRTASATGIQLQQRNAVVADPRIRGLRSYQYQMYGDNGLFFPARLDLDTPVTRFDPASVRDVIVVKGPYSVLYGPALATIDVATLDSPRFDRFEAHGRTGLTYQTNGARWNELQSVWAGGPDWGMRVTYNGLQGNDYTAGNGQLIPSSYLFQNVNWAMGLNLTPNSTLEFKGVRNYQQNVEYPGLYFDIGDQNTEAYVLRYVLRDQGLFDRLTVETWYNTTVGTGVTSGGAKQAFVQDLLAVSFNPFAFNQQGFDLYRSFPILTIPQAVAANATIPGAQPLNLFRDLSTSRFATSSLGYRAFAEWGDVESGRLILGSDARITGQGLEELIRIEQISGRNLNTGAAILPGQPAVFTQTQGIPNSNSVNPGLFLNGEVPVTDRLTFRSGGRMDWVRTSTHNRLITGNIDLFGPPGSTSAGRFQVDPLVYSSNPFDPNTTRDFYLLAGYLQSEYKLTDRLTGVMAVGHAQRAPTLTELYATGPFIGVLQQGTSRLIGDPHLDPEKLTQFDVGLQADLGRVRGGINGFYGWVHDYITFDQNKGGPGLTQVVFTNTDLATLAGGELFALADVNDWLTAFGTLTYVQGIDQTHNRTPRAANLASSRRNDPATGQFATATEPLPQIPPLESRLGLRLHNPQPDRRWQLEVSARIVTAQNSVATSLGELRTPGFTVFTVRGFWQVNDSILLTAGVENFGNKFYREHLDPISGNILGVSPLFRPGTNFYFGSQVTY
jgi:outer membrane receptor protein involved in Fe transport